MTILLLLLALLAYTAYYYTQNRRLPTLGIAPPGANVVTPPQFLFAFSGEGANTLKRPVGVGVGPDGRVYVVDFGNKRVSIFTNQGRFLSSFNTVAKGAKLSNPVHLAIKGNEVWVTDRRLRSISVFDLEGKFLRTFEPKNEKLNWTPLALGFDNDGALRVTDVGNTKEHRVHLLLGRGLTYGDVREDRPDQPAWRGSRGASSSPTASPWMPRTTSTSPMATTVGSRRSLRTGAFKSFIDVSGVPRGIAIDKKQRLYVVDALANDVGSMRSTARRSRSSARAASAQGSSTTPTTSRSTAQGRIYVTDRENNQVQVWGWPVAALPAIPLPKNPLYWLACLLPLLLLPLLLLRRKIRIIVTPDFIDGLIEANEIAAVAGKSRIRLIAPIGDEPLYEGRIVEEVTLAELITFEEYSDSDVRSLIDKLQVTERQGVLHLHDLESQGPGYSGPRTALACCARRGSRSERRGVQNGVSEQGRGAEKHEFVTLATIPERGVLYGCGVCALGRPAEGSGKPEANRT